MSNFCAPHQHYSVCNIDPHIPYTIGSEVWRKRVESMDTNEVLAQSCGTLVAEVIKYMISRLTAGMHCSARVKLRNRILVGYYSRTLLK